MMRSDGQEYIIYENTVKQIGRWGLSENPSIETDSQGQ